MKFKSIDEVAKGLKRVKRSGLAGGQSRLETDLCYDWRVAECELLASTVTNILAALYEEENRRPSREERATSEDVYIATNRRGSFFVADMADSAFYTNAFRADLSAATRQKATEAVVEALLQVIERPGLPPTVHLVAATTYFELMAINLPFFSAKKTRVWAPWPAHFNGELSNITATMVRVAMEARISLLQTNASRGAAAARDDRASSTEGCGVRPMDELWAAFRHAAAAVGNELFEGALKDVQQSTNSARAGVYGHGSSVVDWVGASLALAADDDEVAAVSLVALAAMCLGAHLRSTMLNEALSQRCLLLLDCGSSTATSSPPSSSQQTTALMRLATGDWAAETIHLPRGRYASTTPHGQLPPLVALPASAHVVHLSFTTALEQPQSPVMYAVSAAIARLGLRVLFDLEQSVSTITQLSDRWADLLKRKAQCCVPGQRLKTFHWAGKGMSRRRNWELRKQRRTEYELLRHYASVERYFLRSRLLLSRGPAGRLCAHEIDVVLGFVLGEFSLPRDFLRRRFTATRDGRYRDDGINTIPFRGEAD